MSDAPPFASVRAGLRAKGGALRAAVVATLVSAMAGSFAYAGGWLSPHRLTPAGMVDTFEQVSGPHAGFRRNHAKGVGIAGTFESNGQGQALSKAVVFNPGPIPVIGRFALAGGNPYAADAPRSVRSMALLFTLANGEEWRTGMNAIPVFAVRTPQAFRDLLVASSPEGATGKPNAARMAAFLALYPESARAMAEIRHQPVSSGFANSTFNSLNAFRFVDAAGHSTPVRWSMVPVEPFASIDAHPLAANNENALFDALAATLHEHPLAWHLIVTVGETGDPTADATVAWPSNRRRLDVGTLTIDHVEGEQTSPARDINFDPLVLPDGISGSDDPLLSARSAAYSSSFTRREGEARQPSAVTVPEVAK
jgi:catalase